MRSQVVLRGTKRPFIMFALVRKLLLLAATQNQNPAHVSRTWFTRFALISLRRILLETSLKLYVLDVSRLTTGGPDRTKWARGPGLVRAHGPRGAALEKLVHKNIITFLFSLFLSLYVCPCPCVCFSRIRLVVHARTHART